MSIYDWSTNPANNTSKPGIDWSEGMLPSAVNNSSRQMMADVATFLTGPTFSGGFTVTGNSSVAGTLTTTNLAATSTITVNGNTVYHTGNFNPALYAQLTGATFTGPVIAVNGGGEVFRARGTGQSFALYNLAGNTRYGYIQHDALDISFGNEAAGGARFVFGGSAVVTISAGGAIAASGAITQAGNQVWHAGNFTPGSYALLAGATFSAAFGRDANFTLDLSSGKPRITFDAGDYLEYDRTANKLTLYIGSAAKWSVDSSGNLKVSGSITASTTP